MNTRASFESLHLSVVLHECWLPFTIPKCGISGRKCPAFTSVAQQHHEWKQASPPFDSAAHLVLLIRQSYFVYWLQFQLTTKQNYLLSGWLNITPQSYTSTILKPPEIMQLNVEVLWNSIVNYCHYFPLPKFVNVHSQLNLMLRERGGGGRGREKKTTSFKQERTTH